MMVAGLGSLIHRPFNAPTPMPRVEWIDRVAISIDTLEATAEAITTRLVEACRLLIVTTFAERKQAGQFGEWRTALADRTEVIDRDGSND